MTGSRLLLIFVVVFIAVDIVYADDRPPWLIGVYADYSATSEYVPSAGRYIDSFRTEADAGTPGFGISATRMLKGWFGVGGEIMGQVYRWKSNIFGFDIGPIYWPRPRAAADYENGPSGTDFRFNLLFRALLLSKPSASTHMAFPLGVGVYGYRRSEFGFHGGLLVRHLLDDKKAFFLGSRVHLIPMPSKIGALVQLVMGIEFRVEAKRR
ncbi:MAG: hypothetical protein GYA46_05780 [candidate division Zixibacteria bacterium]|nr:hypothetical protein [candidate division Zixibacteria bacterium]